MLCRAVLRCTADTSSVPTSQPHNIRHYVVQYKPIYILTLPCACLCVCDQNTPSKAERREMANSILAISRFAKQYLISEDVLDPGTGGST